MTERKPIPEWIIGTASLTLLYASLWWSFSKAVKQQVRQQQHNICADCHQHTHKLEVHHKIPQSMGGSDNINNAIGLCGPELNDCHEKWDRLALDKHIIFPGIPMPPRKK